MLYNDLFILGDLLKNDLHKLGKPPLLIAEHNAAKRKTILLSIIGKRPRIRHSEILRLVVPKHMAKRTAESELAKLAEAGIIDARKESYGKKFYTIPLRYPEDVMLKVVANLISELEKIVMIIRKDFGTFPRIKKSTIILHLIKALNDVQGIVTLITKGSEYPEALRQKARYDELIKGTYNFIHSVLLEPDSHLIFPALRNDCMVSYEQLKRFLNEKDAFYKVKI